MRSDEYDNEALASMDPQMDTLFRALKPACVAVLEAAKGLSDGRSNVKVVQDRLETLQHRLSTESTTLHRFSPQLAEYVFFPISQVLKGSQKASIRCLELSLRCTVILVECGWRHHLPPQTAAQLVILCTLLAEKTPSGLPFHQSTEELQCNALNCLERIFSAAKRNDETRKLLAGDTNRPQLGKTITVVLDAIEDGASPNVHLAATETLETLLISVNDREIHAAFLPGVISRLVRVLTPSTKARRAAGVLSGCLEIVDNLITSTLGHRSSMAKSGVAVKCQRNSPDSIIDDQWLEQASTQLKPALVSIFRLRSHSNAKVTETLAHLCLTVVRHCQDTLPNCINVALETLLVIATTPHGESVTLELEMLLHANASIRSSLQELLYDSLQSMTTVIQGADEQAKATKLGYSRKAYELLLLSDAQNPVIDTALANALRGSVVITLAMGARKQSTLPAVQIQSLDLAVHEAEQNQTTFDLPLVYSRGQEQTLGAIESFAKLVATSQAACVTFATDLVRDLRHSHGEARIANFWLLLTLTTTALQKNRAVEQFLEFDAGDVPFHSEWLDALYASSLGILTDTPHEQIDSRLQALALRGVALQAQSAGVDFRAELIDALYPVLNMLATPDAQLQRDSMTALNVMTHACKYPSVERLVVENVDYLTNAVALKLNAFDVSPQAPQVLLMMVRLAGPGLLPYLEDTVESIFAALEDYHGYPALVELLFRVLGVMAEEGAKAPQLLLADGRQRSACWGNEKWAPTTMAGLVTLVKLEKASQEPAADADDISLEPHPSQPWSTLDQPPANSQPHGDEGGPQADSADRPPPAPKTYNLLFKITELTQHFLPSASPSLRTSLLRLIGTTVPAISRHEDSFLPLINTLWPEVVARLDDDEPYVIATALDIVAVLCVHARDFMRSRVTQLWPRMVEIWRGFRVGGGGSAGCVATGNTDRAHALARGTPSRGLGVMLGADAPPATYTDTTARLVRESWVATLASIVEHVPLTPEHFDEALELMTPELHHDVLRSAFETENSDATWLAMARNGLVDTPEPPCAPPGSDWEFAAFVR